MYPMNIPNRRVFIVGEDLLFEEGIAQLLTTKSKMHIFREKYIDDPWLLDFVSRKLPDVILLAESKTLGTDHLLDLIFSVPSLARSQVVVVRLDNNIVDIYEFPELIEGKKICKQQQFNIQKPDELVALVQGDLAHIENDVFSLLPCDSDI